MKIILGIGCDRGTSLQTLETTIDLALQAAQLNHESVQALATIDKKNDEHSILSLSEQRGWPLYFFTAEQLANVEVPNPSEVVRKFMGTPAVAEAAAILAAKTTMADLIVEKVKFRGNENKNATISVVRLSNE